MTGCPAVDCSSHYATNREAVELAFLNFAHRQKYNFSIDVIVQVRKSKTTRVSVCSGQFIYNRYAAPTEIGFPGAEIDRAIHGLSSRGVLSFKRIARFDTLWLVTFPGQSAASENAKGGMVAANWAIWEKIRPSLFRIAKRRYRQNCEDVLSEASIRFVKQNLLPDSDENLPKCRKFAMLKMRESARSLLGYGIGGYLSPMARISMDDQETIARVIREGKYSSAGEAIKALAIPLKPIEDVAAEERNKRLQHHFRVATLANAQLYRALREQPRQIVRALSKLRHGVSPAQVELRLGMTLDEVYAKLRRVSEAEENYMEEEI